MTEDLKANKQLDITNQFDIDKLEESSNQRSSRGLNRQDSLSKDFNSFANLYHKKKEEASKDISWPLSTEINIPPKPTNYFTFQKEQRDRKSFNTEVDPKILSNEFNEIYMSPSQSIKSMRHPNAKSNSPFEYDNSFEAPTSKERNEFLSYLKPSQVMSPNTNSNHYGNKSVIVNPILDMSVQIPRYTSSRGSINNTASRAYSMAMKALQDKVKFYQEKVKDLEREYLQTKDAFGKETQRVHETAITEINSLRSTEAKLKERVEIIEKQNAELTQFITTIQNEKETMMKKNMTLEAQNQKFEEIISELESENLGQATEIEKLQSLLDDTKLSLQETLRNEKALHENYSKTISELKVDKENLNSKNNQLAEHVKKLEKDFNDLKKIYQDRINDLALKNEALTIELGKVKDYYSDQIGDFEKELSSIESSHAKKIQEYENNFEKIKHINVGMEELLQMKNKELETLKAKFEEIIRQSQKQEYSRANNSSFLYENLKNLNNIVHTPISKSNSAILDKSNFMKKNVPYNPHLQSAGKEEDEFLQSLSIQFKKGAKGEQNSAFDVNESHIRLSQDFKNISNIQNKFYMQGSPKDAMGSNINDSIITKSLQVDNFEQSKYKGSPVRDLNHDIEKYLASTENNSLAGTEKKSLSQAGTSTFLPLQEMKSANDFPDPGSFGRNLSFGNNEASAMESVEKINHHQSSANASRFQNSRNKKESDYAEFKQLYDQISEKEKELKGKNLEYQELSKKLQGLEDSKERSKIRGQLISLTEVIQKLTEQFYSLKKKEEQYYSERNNNLE